MFYEFYTLGNLRLHRWYVVKLEYEARHPLEDDSQLITQGKNGKLIKLGARFSCKSSNCLSNHTESQARALPGSLGQSAHRPPGRQVRCHAFLAVTTYSQAPNSPEAAVTSTCMSLLMRQAHESKNSAHSVSRKQHGWGRGGSKVWPFCPLGSVSFVLCKVFRPREGTNCIETTSICKDSNSH